MRRSSEAVWCSIFSVVLGALAGAGCVTSEAVDVESSGADESVERDGSMDPLPKPCTSTNTPCIPDYPDCGPDELCLTGPDGKATCQCPPCTASSATPCNEKTPCTDPAETCYGLDGETYGECACVVG
jgi:hypothetical protein